MPDLEEVPGTVYGNPGLLPFPTLWTEDNSYFLPTYSSVVYTSKEVDLENLDRLQLELEALLSSVVLRSRGIQNEVDLLVKSEKKRVKRSRSKSLKLKSVQLFKDNDLLPSKRKCLSRSAKEIQFTKFKEIPKVQKAKLTPTKETVIEKTEIPPKVNHDTELIQERQDAEIEAAPAIVQKRALGRTRKNAHKFWLSVERYCRPVTYNDIKMLNFLVCEHRHDLSKCNQMPPLGEHYTSRWAKKDLEEEQNISDLDAGSKIKPANGTSSFALKLLNKAFNFAQSISLLPRKTNALGMDFQQQLSINMKTTLERNQQDPNVDETGTACMKEESDGDSFPSTSNSQESVNLVSDGEHLKTKEHKTYPYGRVPAVSGTLAYLDVKPREIAEDSFKSHLVKDLAQTVPLSNDCNVEDDEIATEIKRCQKLLKALVSNNLIQLQRCQKLGLQEMKKQELRKKLKICDAAIIDIQKKITQSKLKNQLHTEDRERAWKLLKERELLIREIDAYHDYDVSENEEPTV